MWAAIIPVIGTLLDKFIPDASKAAEAKAALLEMQAKGELQLLLGQQETNKVEASHPSVFVSGWRPAIGWVCAIALAIYFVPRFILGMVFWSKLAWAAQGVLPPMPEMGIGDILGLTATLLGMATLRTTEKIKDVARGK